MSALTSTGMLHTLAHDTSVPVQSQCCSLFPSVKHHLCVHPETDTPALSEPSMCLLLFSWCVLGPQDSAETMARLTHTLSQIQAAADASANDLVRAQDENHRAVTRLDTKVCVVSSPGSLSAPTRQSRLLFRRHPQPPATGTVCFAGARSSSHVTFQLLMR